jgi:hypothetical protein
MKTTTVTVNGERWEVPRGFGAAYLREARGDLALAAKGKPGQIIERVQSVLGLIGYHATVEEIADWPLQKRVEAVVYGGNVHLRASDNPIQRHPKPSWLPEPWRGPEVGDGVFQSPGPTPVRQGARA